MNLCLRQGLAFYRQRKESVSNSRWQTIEYGEAVPRVIFHTYKLYCLQSIVHWSGVWAEIRALATHGGEQYIMERQYLLLYSISTKYIAYSS